MLKLADFTIAQRIDFDTFAFPRLHMHTFPNGDTTTYVLRGIANGEDVDAYTETVAAGQGLTGEARALIEVFNYDTRAGWYRLFSDAAAAEHARIDEESADADEATKADLARQRGAVCETLALAYLASTSPLAA